MVQKLHEAADELYRRASSIRAVRGQQMNPFSRALAALEQVADDLQAPLAIVGGLAGIHLGAAVTTLDIDIVVPTDQLDALLERATQHGFAVRARSPDGWHRLTFADPEGDVSIEVLPEGGKTPRDPAYAPAVPSPQSLGVCSGLGYASFAGWVAMKLVANRDKDRYHLGETLKHASQTQGAEAVELVCTMHASYLVELKRLVRAAEDENQENW